LRGGTSIGSASFTDVDLDLSDLRGLHREPLTQEDYNELQTSLAKTVADEKLREEILKHIEAGIGRYATLETAHDVLCDHTFDKEIKGCLAEADISAYDAKLAPLLGELGCHDAAVAPNMASRAQKSFYERRTFQPKLAKALLALACAGGAKLPEETKKELKEIIKRDEMTTSQQGQP